MSIALEGGGHPKKAFRILRRVFWQNFFLPNLEGCVAGVLVLVSILPEKAHLQEKEKCV